MKADDHSPADREGPRAAARLAPARRTTAQAPRRPAVAPAAAATPAVAAAPLALGAPLALVLFAQHPVEGCERVVDDPVSSPIRDRN